jgi:hypothetical protein
LAGLECSGQLEFVAAMRSYVPVPHAQVTHYNLIAQHAIHDQCWFSNCSSKVGNVVFAWKVGLFHWQTGIGFAEQARSASKVVLAGCLCCNSFRGLYFMQHSFSALYC